MKKGKEQTNEKVLLKQVKDLESKLLDTEKKVSACEAEIGLLRRNLAASEKKSEELVRDGEKMGEEILVLRRSIASYKSAHTVFKKRIVGYESSICDLNNELADKDGVIRGLHDQIAKLAESKAKLEYTIDSNDDYIKELEATVSELRRPWWKKIF